VTTDYIPSIVMTREIHIAKLIECRITHRIQGTSSIVAVRTSFIAYRSVVYMISKYIERPAHTTEWSQHRVVVYTSGTP